MDTQSSRLHAASWLVAAGRQEEAGATLNVPPILASNFLLGDGRGYSRDGGTDSWEALEEVVGGLEGGQGVAFASGMAAVAAVFDQLPAGSKVILPENCYQGVIGIAEAGQARGYWTVNKLPLEATDAWLEAASNADLIWLESPSNPLLVVADLPKICGASRKAGSILAVDNTFATPLNQRPLELGADVSIQSATKYIGGHSDLLSGVATTKDPEILAGLAQSRKLSGATPGALETFLAVRGARTMALRLERAQHNAQLLAERLQEHPQVMKVRYPGLESHPTYELARRQLQGFGAIISFDLDGEAAFADRVCQRVRLIRHATSLGAVESTMERRAAVQGQEHLPPSMLRLSVGIEQAEDLWRDLQQAI